MTVRAPGARACLTCVSLTAVLAVAVPSEASPAHAFPSRSSSITAVSEAAIVERRQPVSSDVVHQVAAPAAPTSRPRPWWGWVLLGRLHPMVVHFPIALLTVAAIVELLHVVRRKPVPSEAGTYCLAFGVVGALASVCLGTLNAGQQTLTGEAALALERHQLMGWISTIAAMAALGTGQLARRAGQFRTVAVYVGLVLATSAVVGATGHLGGGLVYGEDYLTGVLPWNQRPEVATASPAAAAEVAAPVTAAALLPTVPARTATPAPAATGHPAPAPRTSAAPAVPVASEAPVGAAQAPADAVDFARDVMPIIKRTCVECHGPDKVKARLRMDSVEGLQKGGKSGALVKAGDPENSLMLRRVLGLDGEDQMPLDKDPLTEKQIDTLRRWIAAGASYPAAGSQ